ncbi:MAG: SET domain-containing protein-lysine N-methyltransferase [Gammaproteobacteria bacterium]
MTRAEERALPDEINDNGIFVTPDLVIGVKNLSEIEGATYVNHSCDPNAGIKGQIFLVAMRDIAVGEEITFDYAMALHRSPGNPPYKFSCECGSSRCRGEVTDEDWKLPELRQRYAGHFQYYLEELIRKEKNPGPNAVV